MKPRGSASARLPSGAMDLLGACGSRLGELLLSRLSLRQRLTLRSVKARIRGRRPRWSPPVLDIRLTPVPEPSRRALISYLSAPFLGLDGGGGTLGANRWRAVAMARALNTLGYVVDAVDCTDTTFLPERLYDAFIGHGGHNFEAIAARLSPSAVKIYYFSGCRWDVHNERELARLEDLRRRRGVLLPPDRLITASEEGALAVADALLGVGNEATRRTFAGHRSVHLLPSMIRSEEHVEALERDFQSGRRHFLFFAGPGNVHKGLDLLLDAFAGLKDEHLWICTRIDRPFAALYGDLLTTRSNIHLLEWVRPCSRAYHEVVQRCNWTILPSCAEGIATSVVEGMNHGLIPVVSDFCGIDVEGFGLSLASCSVEEIAMTVRDLSHSSETRCREMSRAAVRAARDGHSGDVADRRIREALESILGGRALLDRTAAPTADLASVGSAP